MAKYFWEWDTLKRIVLISMSNVHSMSIEIFANIFSFCVYNLIMLDQPVKPGIARVHVSVCTCWSRAVLLGLPNTIVGESSVVFQQLQSSDLNFCYNLLLTDLIFSCLSE